MVWSAAMDRSVMGVWFVQPGEVALRRFSEIANSTNITNAACPVLLVELRESGVGHQRAALGPALEGQVRGDYQARPLVGAAHNLEQELGARLRERDVSEFVQDDQVLPLELLLQSFEVMGSERLTGALLDRLTHRVHIIEANGESYRLRESRRRTKKVRRKRQ